MAPVPLPTSYRNLSLVRLTQDYLQIMLRLAGDGGLLLHCISGMLNMIFMSTLDQYLNVYVRACVCRMGSHAIVCVAIAHVVVGRWLCTPNAHCR